MPTVSIDLIKKVFAEGGLEIGEPQCAKLMFYGDILCEYNQKINLTAITDPEGIAMKHFLDSVYPFLTEDILPEGAKLIDVGTGAGFPSCPLKILRPDIKLTLLDSLNKRVEFLKLLSDETSLEAECIHGRAEEFGHKPEYRESYDIATARAVANLTALSEYCMPFVKVGASFVALKGSDGPSELKAAQNAVKTLGGEVSLCKEYALPNGDGRTLIVIKKTHPTPEKYPRNKGQMTKKPL